MTATVHRTGLDRRFGPKLLEPLLFVLMVVACQWYVSDGPAMLATNAVVALFAMPGWLAMRSAGAPRDWGAVIVDSVLGVAATCLVIAIVGSVLDHFSLALCAAITLSITALVTFRRKPGDSLASAPRSLLINRTALTAVLLLFALIAAPLADAGKTVATGMAFRSFFNADFFKHMGIATAFLDGHMPPYDPYGSAARLHYYWLQHMIPGAALLLGGLSVTSLGVSKAVVVLQGAACTVLMLRAADRLGATPRHASIAFVLLIAFFSFDLLPLWLIEHAGSWLWLDVNQELLDVGYLYDASSHVAGSSLFRFSLYLPQHQLSLMLLLAWLVVQHDADRRWWRLVALVALPAASVLLGAIAIGCLFMYHAINWLQGQFKPDDRTEVLAGFLGLVLPLALGMISLTANNAVATLGTTDPRTAERLSWFVPQWIGTYGALAVAGLWPLGANQGDRQVRLAATVLVFGGSALMALTLFLPASSRLGIDLQLKGSFVIATGLFLRAALVLQTWPPSRTAIILVTGAVLGGGALVHDWLWHRCLDLTCAKSRRTTVIPAGDVIALDWMRKNLPKGAVVQEYPEPDFIARGRDVWTPVLGGHSVRFSRRGTEVTPEQLEWAKQLFDPALAPGLVDEARRNGIAYLYVSRSHQSRGFAELNAALRKLSNVSLVYTAENVTIWSLQR